MEDIKKTTMQFFGEIYKMRDVLEIVAQLDSPEGYPNMFEEAYFVRFNEKISLEEIKNVLKSFVADKSLGPDG